jgi:hypothetical protein
MPRTLTVRQSAVLVLCLCILSAGCSQDRGGYLKLTVVSEVPEGVEAEAVDASEIIAKEAFEQVANGTHPNFQRNESSPVVVGEGTVRVDSAAEIKEFVNTIPVSYPDARGYPEGRYFIYRGTPIVIEYAALYDNG